MATQRRTVALDEKPSSPNAVHLEKSDITPAVPSAVIAKLLGFTFAMITMPIGGYFLTRDYLYSGNTTYAGATAAFIANVVLLGYVLVAFAEDRSDRDEARKRDSKKSR